VLQWFAALPALGLVFARLPRVYPIFSVVPLLLVPAAAEFLFMGTREWTAQNGYHPRYLLGTIESLQTFWALLAATPLAGWAASRCRQRILFGIAAVVLFGCATYQFGWPSPDRPRRDIVALTSPWTKELKVADVDAFGGSYWTVWPAVFGMNMDRPNRFYGVTDRGRVLIARSDRSPRNPLRVAVLKSPAELQWFLTYIKVCNLAPPVKIGEHGPFEIYETYPLDAP
jgi:hypothetical protein